MHNPNSPEHELTIKRRKHNAEYMQRKRKKDTDTIINLTAQNHLLIEMAKHYAGEPFVTNDIYMDIFDLFKVVNGSVTEFDSEKFSELARQTLTKVRELQDE